MPFIRLDPLLSFSFDYLNEPVSCCLIEELSLFPGPRQKRSNLLSKSRLFPQRGPEIVNNSVIHIGATATIALAEIRPL